MVDQSDRYFSTLGRLCSGLTLVAGVGFGYFSWKVHTVTNAKAPYFTGLEQQIEAFDTLDHASHTFGDDLTLFAKDLAEYENGLPIMELSPTVAKMEALAPLYDHNDLQERTHMGTMVSEWKGELAIVEAAVKTYRKRTLYAPIALGCLSLFCFGMSPGLLYLVRPEEYQPAV